MKGRKHGTNDEDRKKFGFLFGRSVYKWWAKERERLLKEIDEKYSGVWHVHNVKVNVLNASASSALPTVYPAATNCVQCLTCGVYYVGSHACVPRWP